jgi:TonB family protein
VKQVLPDVPAKARRTIHGKVTVSILVGVDDTGSVLDAKNESPASSRFFGNLALQAARQWKFAPAKPNRSDSREWILRFQFVSDPERPVSVRAIPGH